MRVSHKVHRANPIQKNLYPNAVDERHI